MGITGDWSPTAPALITSSHVQANRVFLGIPNDPYHQGPDFLEPDELTVTFSEDWSPRVQASMSAAIAPLEELAPGHMKAMDPRKNFTAGVYAGYLTNGGTVDDVHLMASLYVTDRTTPDNGATVRLTAESIETRAFDCLYFGPDTTKTFLGVREAIEFLVNYASPGKCVKASVIGYGWQAALVTGFQLTAGRSIWEHLMDIALLAGVRVQAGDVSDLDGGDGWRITRKVTAAAAPVVVLTHGENSSIAEQTTDTLSREGYYDAALLRYTWRTTAGVDQTIYGAYPTGGVNIGQGRKSFYEERPGPVTQAVADAAAKSVVRALSTRGDSYTVEAVAAYWLRDGDTVLVRLGTGEDVLHIVRSVTFHAHTGRMSVITRQPSNLGT